jgi:2-polyprenyl-3-methyl-5-hydroxy-6-metoxy-1,4-benzoquinol methylase
VKHKLEKVKCDLCGADDPITQFNRMDRYSGDEYQLATCSQCGLIYLPTRPAIDELDRLYPDDYEAYYLLEDKSDSRNWHLRRALNLQLQFVETQSMGKGKLLDVGCATGNFLKIAQENGWQVLGIEPVEKAAQIAREYYQLEVINGTLDTAVLKPATFDVITMWDVLEHLPSPKQALIRSRELLKPGGILVFSIPNLSSFDRYLFGKYWIGWDAPRHFNLFTEQALNQLLEITGLEVIAKGCILGGKGTFLLSLDTIHDHNHFASGIKKLYPLISALLWPYRQFSYLVNRGPIITYTVRKE